MSRSSAYLHLSIVYLVWGSTFLAIRVAVREGSGFPPFTMAATRVLLAGILLILWAVVSGRQIRPSRKEWLTLIGSGLLLWTGGNGLVVWAEQRAESGLAALMIATMPLWVAMIEAILDRRRPSALLIGATLIGLMGVGMLSAPVLASSDGADLVSVGALTLASLSWALGVVLQNRNPVNLPLRVSSAYQHLAGGMGFLLLIALANEPSPTPDADAWLAWGYLVLFGSVLGFTSYVHTLRALPLSIATTNAYVNPVIAVILGAVILNEPITAWIVAGAALILIGVAGVFRDRRLQSRKAKQRGETA